MKYIFVFNVIVFNVKHTKLIKKNCVRKFVFNSSTGKGAENPPGSHGIVSMEIFRNHY